MLSLVLLASLSTVALSIQRVDLGEGRRGVIDARATAPALALCATGVSNEPPQKVARVVRARGGRFISGISHRYRSYGDFLETGIAR